MTDLIAEFKSKQRETWTLGNFGDMAVFSAVPAGHLVRFAGVRAGQKVLDVGTGTGVVAITAARLGAVVSGLDLTPALLDQARQSAPIAGLTVDWKEGDAESLPYGDASFDVVLSQFGHMFAPRPEVAVKEMLRVLKPGGRIAFATWPPEQFIGRSFVLSGKYVPPPQGGAPPPLWGDIGTVRERLGAAVKDLFFERGIMGVPSLSPEHYLAFMTAKLGPFIKTVGALQKEPERLEQYRKEFLELIGSYLVDNVVRHEYLLTRATKV
jgi:ubiquinone/menaquinone biosynthesis C-methylase UbiE